MGVTRFFWFGGPPSDLRPDYVNVNLVFDGLEFSRRILVRPDHIFVENERAAIPSRGVQDCMYALQCSRHNCV